MNPEMHAEYRAQRSQVERAYGYAPRHAQGVGKHRLMTWRAPRLPRVAHVLLVAGIALGLTATGALVAAQLIADDLMCVFVIGCWGFMVGGAAQAYAEAAIKR